MLRFTLDFYTEFRKTKMVDLIFEIDVSKVHMITHYINRAMRKGAFSESSRYVHRLKRILPLHFLIFCTKEPIIIVLTQQTDNKASFY